MSETQTTANPQVETDLDSNEILKGLEDAAVEAGYVPESELNKANGEEDAKKKDDGSEEEFEKEMDAMKKKYPEMMKKYMGKKEPIAKAGDDVSTISSVIDGHIQEAESALSEMNGVDVKGIFSPFKEIAKAIEGVAQSHNANSASFEDRLSSVEDKLEKAVDVVNKMIPGIALLVKKHVETEKSLNKAGDEVNGDLSKAAGETEPAQAKGIVGAVDETGEEPKTPEARFAKAVDELVKSHGVKNAVNDFFAKANEAFATNGDVTAGEIAKLVAGLNHYEYDKLKNIPSRYINKAEELIKAL